MAQEWIEQLAGEIKQKNQQPAEEFGRAQHAATVVAEKGKQFFVTMVQALQHNVDALRSQLQGDLTAAETGLQTVRACEVKVTRARFPWVDATIEHHGDTITLDYAKGSGTAAEGTPERKQCTYTFRVTPEDCLYVRDAFAVEHAEYDQPDSLARRITELLFTP
ncbi:MAG: hypothetical protein M3O02_03095 [Acidobacteriota bacterium]|nr:hypothetical protein [Acidobacteriota bacterium]